MKKENKNTKILMVIVICLITINIFGGGIIIFNNKKISELNDVLNVAIRPLNMKNVDTIDDKKIVLSIDDTITIFKDLTKHQKDYNSIFENDILKYFKQLHDEYNIVVTFYVFYDFDDFKLEEATDKFKDEFIKNSDWLKFGFHGYESESNYATTTADKAKKDYEAVLNELERIVGAESIDTNIRIHTYAGSKESIDAMKDSKYSITGLYTADDDRKSYYLNNEDSELIKDNDFINKDNVYFVHTDYRLEKINDFEDVINELEDEQKILTVFTHEWLLNDSSILLKLKMFCDYAVLNNYDFSFLNNI